MHFSNHRVTFGTQSGGGVLVKQISDTFQLVVFMTILRSFGSLFAKWPACNPKKMAGRRAKREKNEFREYY